jgi:hypothetical protein
VGRAIRREDNSFLKAALKLIPSEVVAVYLFLQGVLPERLVPHLVVRAVLVVLTPLYLRCAMEVRSPAQLVVSTLSLIVWIYALGQGPVRFLPPPYYEPWYGSTALAIWTLLPPILLYQRRPGSTGPAAGSPPEQQRGRPTI